MTEKHENEKRFDEFVDRHRNGRLKRFLLVAFGLFVLSAALVAAAAGLLVLVVLR